MTKRRQISLLPNVHQTDPLKRFFNSTVDQLFQNGNTVPISGFIGRRPEHFDPSTDFYKPEITNERSRYQLEPLVVSEQNNEITSQLFYEDLLSLLARDGADVSDPNRLFGAGYYSWSPPIDIDRIMNFRQYYWVGSNTTSLELTVPGVELGNRIYSNGIDTNYDLPPKLPSRTDSEENVIVLVNGVIINSITVANEQVIFEQAPEENAFIVILRYGNVSLGDTDTFTIPNHIPSSEENDDVFVYLNGRETQDFIVNQDGLTITLDTVPPIGTHVIITRIRDLRAFIEGNTSFNPEGLTFQNIDALSDGMKVRIVDPTNFLVGYDLKAYEHPWDEQSFSTYFVEGVDIAIELIPIEDIALTGDGLLATDQRYVVVARADRTRSFWSRINRWVHIDSLINPDDATPENRASRPIIEFLRDVQQYNYGTHRISNSSSMISVPPLFQGQEIDFTDFNGLPEGLVTVDGGETPVRGDIIFVNLPNSPHNNQQYRIDTVVDEDGETSLYLLEPLGELEYGAITAINLQDFWFDGQHWNKVAAAGDYPLFDLFDCEGHSLSDVGIYPESNFNGSPIFSFKQGTGKKDELTRVPLVRDKFGQIVFENNLQTTLYSYRDGDINGYYFYNRNDVFENSWHLADDDLVQQIDENNISEIPLNLQANPDFDTPDFLSRNDWFSHFTSILENQIGFEGSSFARNNWNNTARDVSRGLVIIQHEAPLLKLMGLLSNDSLSLINAINFNRKEYIRFKSRFLSNTLQLSKEEDLSTTTNRKLVDTVMARINAGKSNSFPFYDSQVGSTRFIPLTPSLIGITPLYQPEIFTDDTIGSLQFIRGHDGSTTALFGDDRDRALLALEQDIYDNAISLPETSPLIDLINGKFRSNAPYDNQHLINLLISDFEEWLRENNGNLVNNDFDKADPFTFNYSETEDRYGELLPAGHWRGIYRHFFDTETPHITPWEMLGFANKPDWWETRYGPAPYTRDNTVLWDDIGSGIIREGDREGEYTNLIREDIYQILPVDKSGNLIDPISATIVLRKPTTQSASKDWVFGDGSNVETSWRKTSSFSYSLAKAIFLLRPAFFVERYWDVENRAEFFDQVVQLPERRRIHHSEIFVNGETLSDGSTKHTTGIQNWIIENLRQQGLSEDKLGNVIRGLKVKLGHKVGGFTTNDRMQVSAESFGLIPDEDISIVLHESPNKTEFFYSGVLIENTSGGWQVVGYNPNSPMFTMLKPNERSRQKSISLDGDQIIFNPWSPNVFYKEGMLVEYKNTLYSAISNHQSSQTFEERFWEVDDRGIERATNIVKQYAEYEEEISIPYGTVFNSKQEVANFLLGYGEYINQIGFETGGWEQAVLNFLRWSEVNWTKGAFMSVSPAAREISFKTDTGIIAEIRNDVYDRNGLTFDLNNLTIDRFEDTTIISADREDIYGLRLYKTELEHCLSFSNTTIFDDVIYDPLYNIRQERLKLSAKVANNWEGRYEAHGFVLDGNDILPNFDKLSEDIREMFDIELADNTTLRDHARHLIGFETKDHLDQLLLSETQQFELYQGLIQQKGSLGALSSILRSNRIGENNQLEFLEEWGFRIGEYGANDASVTMEFGISETFRRTTRKVLHLEPTENAAWFDASDTFIGKPSNFDSLLVDNTTEKLPTAGYARLDEANYILKNIIDLDTRLNNIEILLNEGEIIWLTNTVDWQIHRVSYPTDDRLEIQVEHIESDAVSLEIDVVGFRIQLNREHNLNVDDEFILSGGGVDNTDGVYTVARYGETWIEVDTDIPLILAGSSIPVPNIFRLESTRVSNIDERNMLPFGNGTLSYVDDVDGKWVVYKKINDSWVEYRRQPKKIENKHLQSSTIYDPDSNITQTELQVEPALPFNIGFIDSGSGLIHGVADREIDFKTEYDPADYDNWGKEETGLIWWDISTVNFIDCFTDVVEELSNESNRYETELNYRANNWGRQVPSSSVDIYEWTRTNDPTEVDTLVAESDVDITFGFVARDEFNLRLNRNVTFYYYWKLRSNTIPTNTDRRLSAASIAKIIENPSNAGLIWAAAIAPDAILTSGFSDILNDEEQIFQITYQSTDYDGDVHSEWLLMRPNDKSTPPNNILWNKMLDSVIGYDDNLNIVPDISFHSNSSAGVDKGQSLFGKTPISEVRRSFITIINYILARTNFSNILNLEEKLSASDNIPEYLFWSHFSNDIPLLPYGRFDAIAFTESEKNDLLNSNDHVLLDNRSAESPSFSVWENENDISRGYDHIVDTIEERDFLFGDISIGESIAVRNDDRANGFWTIWEKISDNDNINDGIRGNGQQTLKLIDSQKYNTRDLWFFADWFREDTPSSNPPSVEYDNLISRTQAEGNDPLNTFVRLLDDGNGYWAWYKFEDEQWVVVARENGTIQLRSDFFTSDVIFGVSQDGVNDINDVSKRDGTLEIQPLVKALIEHLLTVEDQNEIWFSMLHFAHTKIDNVSWASKTNFISVLNFNDRLFQSPVASESNIPLLLEYIDEVKPYKSKIREVFVTARPDISIADGVVSDFDKPVYFDDNIDQYRVLSENDIQISDGIYRHRHNNMDKVRTTNISMLYDRISIEGNEGSGAAQRILSFYQPSGNMRANSVADLLGVDFKGTVYDGRTIQDIDHDIILTGTDDTRSQIDVIGSKLRDPNAHERPEELIKVGSTDGLVIKVNDNWGDGSPQHIVRYYDVRRRTAETLSLDVDLLADSVAVFRDGIRASDDTFNYNPLTHTVEVDPILNGKRVEYVAIHAFGFASVDGIKEQKYYEGGDATFILEDAFGGLVEAIVNNETREVSTNSDEVTITGGTSASDAIALTLHNSLDPKPIRKVEQSLSFNDNREWQIDNLTGSKPYHASMIVEVNGLRINPPKTFYADEVLSIFTGTHPIENILVYDEDGTHPVSLFGGDALNENDVISQANGERFLLWEGRIVFSDIDALSRKYRVVINGKEDFTISDSGLLSIPSVSDNDNIVVTSFTNSVSTDIRTHVQEGNKDGIYTIMTRKNGRAWMTVNGKRLIENIDYSIIGSSGGAWDINSFESIAIDGFQTVQFALRLPSLSSDDNIVITTFEGHENHSPNSWQLSTKTPSDALLIVSDDGSYSIAKDAWELTKLDINRRSASLVKPITNKSDTIILDINPMGIPSKMIPTRPFGVPTKKAPSVIWVGGERIEYYGYEKNDSTITLTELRRGTRGTSNQNHQQGDIVFSGDALLDFIPPAPLIGGDHLC